MVRFPIQASRKDASSAEIFKAEISPLGGFSSLQTNFERGRISCACSKGTKSRNRCVERAVGRAHHRGRTHVRER